MKKKLVIGIYVRQSIYDEVGISAEAQIQECKLAASKKFNNYLTEFVIYKDLHSPAVTDNLLQRQALEFDIQDSKIDVLYVYDLSRIGHSARTMMNLFEKLISADIEFVILRDDIDSYYAQSNFQIETIFNVAVAEEQRKKEFIDAH